MDRAHNPYPNEVSHVGQDSEEEEGDNEEEGEEFVEVGEGNGEREGVGSAASGFPVNVLQSAAKTASSSSATIEFSVPSSALDTNNSNDNVKGKRKAGVKISAEQREFRRDL